LVFRADIGEVSRPRQALIGKREKDGTNRSAASILRVKADRKARRSGSNAPSQPSPSHSWS
jgi:hypothetical protein